MWIRIRVCIYLRGNAVVRYYFEVLYQFNTFKRRHFYQVHGTTTNKQNMNQDIQFPICVTLSHPIL